AQRAEPRTAGRANCGQRTSPCGETGGGRRGAGTVKSDDPTGENPPIELERFPVPDDPQRAAKIPEPDPHYVDLGMLYRFAQVEAVRREGYDGMVPLHVAVRGHMGTGKDHDIEQF